MPETWFWAGLLGVLGLVFGSFIATIAIRWPAGRSVMAGRSHCDGCGVPLRARELVPVWSYVVQRRRCRHCGARIATAHLWTELAGMAVGVSSGAMEPGVAGASAAIAGWLLLTLAALDLAALWLPNRLNAALALCGVATGMAGIEPSLSERLLGGLAGFVSLWAVAAAYKRVRGRTGLGGGDPKLFGAIGVWLGWHALPMALMTASLLGLLVVLVLRLTGQRPHATDRLPFGVMLAIGAWGTWIWHVAG